MEPQSIDGDMPLEQILKRLNSRKYPEWNGARLIAGRLALNDPERLLVLARMEAQSYRKRVVLGTMISLIMVSITILLVVLFPRPETLLGVAGMSVACAIGLGFYIPIRARKSMLEVLHTMDDPRFLGTVLTMLVPDGVTEVKTSVTLNREVRHAVTGVLLSMLPLVRQEHRNGLSRAHMQTLMALLWQSRLQPALAVSILRALKHIGDESTFSTLQTLTGSYIPIVREEAAECLEYLRLNADARRQSKTLLRASIQGEEMRTEGLLRPAMGNNEGHPDVLLRPLHNDNDAVPLLETRSADSPDSALIQVRNREE